MKKIRRLLAACLLLGILSGSTLPLAADEAEVVAIRKAYQAIENGKNWVKKTIAVDNKESDVTAITRYEAKDGTLKKLVAKTLNDDGLGTERYYFSGGQIVFIFLEAEYLKYTWQADENGEQRAKGAPQRGKQESRLYYTDEKCLRHLLKQAEGTDQNEAAAALVKSKNRKINDVEQAKFRYQRGMMLAGIQSPKK